MLRVVCVIIYLIKFYYETNSVYGVEQHTSYEVRLNNVIKKLNEYIGGFQSYIGVKSSYNDIERRMRNDFLKNVEHAFKNLKPPRRAGGKFNKKQLANVVAKPIRKIHNRTNDKATMNAVQLIKAHGYNVETHKIETYDGYILTTQRILAGGEYRTKEVVIIHHGLLGSSEDWLLLSSDLSLPCLLSDHGYEVWLLNARGNKYSRAHETLDPKSFEYWDFSFHEMGIYDLTAALTYIADNSEEANLYFIGHSMGATALLVLLSTIPEYNEKLKVAILLAPLAFMYHTKGPLKHFGDFHHHRNVISMLAEEPREFMANLPFHRSLREKFCRGSLKACANPLLLIANGGKEILDDDLMANILKHVPAGGSTKTIIHYMQLINSGSFRMFDLGLLNNLKNYRQKFPLSYNLTAIRLPMLLFSSPADWLSSMPDVAKLVTQIDSVKSHHVIREENFGHLDFLWSKDASQLVYYPIIEALDTMTSRKVNSFVPRML